MNAPEWCEIHIVGHLSQNWKARFEALSIRNEPEGETVLSGRLDQADLHGVFMRIRDLSLTSFSVNRIGATGSS